MHASHHVLLSEPLKVSFRAFVVKSWSQLPYWENEPEAMDGEQSSFPKKRSPEQVLKHLGWWAPQKLKLKFFFLSCIATAKIYFPRSLGVGRKSLSGRRQSDSNCFLLYLLLLLWSQIKRRMTMKVRLSSAICIRHFLTWSSKSHRQVESRACLRARSNDNGISRFGNIVPTGRKLFFLRE